MRGEVYLPKSVLPALNAARVNEGLLAFANARNAAAGTLRASDHFNGQISDSSGSTSRQPEAPSTGAASAARLAVQELSFFAYDLFVPTTSTSTFNNNLDSVANSRNETEEEAVQPSSHAEIRDWLQSWGFMLPGPSAEIDLHLNSPAAGLAEGGQIEGAKGGEDEVLAVEIDGVNIDADAAATAAVAAVVAEVQSSTATTAEALTALLRDAELARKGLSYDVDGVVFKVDSWAQREVSAVECQSVVVR